MIYVLIGVSVALFIPLFVLLLLMRHDKIKEGKIDEENSHLHSLNEKLADRPISDSDLIKRLRTKADAGRSDKSKP
jgi:hypothetical protein